MKARPFLAGLSSSQRRACFQKSTNVLNPYASWSWTFAEDSTRTTQRDWDDSAACSESYGHSSTSVLHSVALGESESCPFVVPDPLRTPRTAPKPSKFASCRQSPPLSPVAC